MANVIKFACKYCGQEVNFPAPQQAGIYAVVCPHCQKQMKVKYSPKPITMNPSSEPAPPSAASLDTEKMRHTPTRRFNSPDELLRGGSSQSQKVSSCVGRLSLVRIGCDKEFYPLHLGDNTVGRKDSSQPSDIEIDGDPTISRRSIKIIVSEANGGYTYSLTVLRTFNPVLVNGASMSVGQTIHINIGASIYLGQTMLRLEK